MRRVDVHLRDLILATARTVLTFSGLFGHDFRALSLSAAFSCHQPLLTSINEVMAEKTGFCLKQPVDIGINRSNLESVPDADIHRFFRTLYLFYSILFWFLCVVISFFHPFFLGIWLRYDQWEPCFRPDRSYRPVQIHFL
jgi:hypothetical protein